MPSDPTHALEELLKIYHDIRIRNGECDKCSTSSCFHFQPAKVGKLSDFLMDVEVVKNIDFNHMLGYLRLITWLAEGFPWGFSHVLQAMTPQQLQQLDFKRSENLHSLKDNEKKSTCLASYVMDLEDEYGTLTTYLAKQDPALINVNEPFGSNKSILLKAIELANEGRSSCLHLIFSRMNIEQIDLTRKTQEGKTLLELSYLNASRPKALYLILRYFPHKKLHFMPDFTVILDKLPPVQAMFRFFVALTDAKIQYEESNGSGHKEDLHIEGLMELAEKADRYNVVHAIDPRPEPNPFFYLTAFFVQVGLFEEAYSVVDRVNPAQLEYSQLIEWIQLKEKIMEHFEVSPAGNLTLKEKIVKKISGMMTPRNAKVPGETLGLSLNTEETVAVMASPRLLHSPQLDSPRTITHSQLMTPRSAGFRPISTPRRQNSFNSLPIHSPRAIPHSSASFTSSNTATNYPQGMSSLTPLMSLARSRAASIDEGSSTNMAVPTESTSTDGLAEGIEKIRLPAVLPKLKLPSR